MQNKNDKLEIWTIMYSVDKHNIKCQFQLVKGNVALQLWHFNEIRTALLIVPYFHFLSLHIVQIAQP